MQKLLDRFGKEFFLLLCLLGLLPALLTNSLWSTAVFPGIESFRWAWFRLDNTRYAFALMAVLAIALGLYLRHRCLLLAVVPLFILSATPLDRIGATGDYAGYGIDASFNLAQAKEQIARLKTSEGRVAAWLARLPPLLPPATWLDTGMLEFQLQQQELDSKEGDVVRQHRRRIEGIVRNLASPYVQRGRPSLWQEFQAEEGRFHGQLAGFARNRAESRSGLASLRPDLATGLDQLETRIALHQRWTKEKSAFYKSLIYLVAASLLWIWFIWRHGVANHVMALFLAIALMASIAVAYAGWADEPWHIVTFVALYPLIVGLITAVTLRMLCRVVQDNSEIWHLFEVEALMKAGALALALWLPFALVLWLNLSLGAWVEDLISSRVYCQHVDREKCVPPERAIVVNGDSARDTFRDDIHVSIDKTYARLEAALLQAGAGTKGKTNDALKLAKSNLMSLFDSALPENLWGYHESFKPADRCGLLNFGCYASNLALGAANAAYKTPRDRIKNAFDDHLTEVEKRISKAADSGAANFQSAVRGEAERASMQTRKYVDLGLLVMAGLSVATAALLLMVVIRALLLIFARVLFSKNRTHFTTITPMETHARLPATCKIDISTTSQLSVDWKHAPLLVKKSFDVDNAAPESLWLPPHAGKWIFSRLANRCWALKRIAHKPSGDSMAFRTSEGARFVTWDIPAGVEVAFRWDSFVAMSESARFGKTVSLKLGTIVLEHVMLPSVRGPGLLIQRTYGEPSRDSASVAPDRLLAWTFGTRFRIEASTRLLSTYLDHCQMRAHADGQALLDAPRERRGSQGLFRELARLVRP